MLKRLWNCIKTILIILLWIAYLPFIVKKELQDETEWEAEGIKDAEDESPDYAYGDKK